MSPNFLTVDNMASTKYVREKLENVRDHYIAGVAELYGVG